MAKSSTAPEPSPYTPAETDFLGRLDALSDRLYRDGQPGVGEEIDRAASMIRFLCEKRLANAAELRRLRAKVRELSGQGRPGVRVARKGKA